MSNGKDSPGGAGGLFQAGATLPFWFGEAELHMPPPLQMLFLHVLLFEMTFNKVNHILSHSL